MPLYIAAGRNKQENATFLPKHLKVLKKNHIFAQKNMETQLVRLDAPYNLICNNRGKIALHIATLIIINEKERSNMSGREVTYPVVKSYPVVSDKSKPGGETWINTELDDCMVICGEGDDVSLQDVKRVMAFCHNHGVYPIKQIPRALFIALKNSNCTITLPKDKDENVIQDYVVNLTFTIDSEANCIVMGDSKSQFFFYDCYYIEVCYDDDGNEYYEDKYAIESLAEMRHIYYLMFGAKGFKSITFTTDNTKFKDFVDQLNNTK